MSRKFSERDPAVLAVVGLLVLAALFLTAINVQRLPLVGGGATYRAAFTEAAGLQPGEEVRVAGIKVGVVRSVDLEGDHVVVRFTARGVRMGDRTEAGVELKSLLGQHYLSVTPAGPGALEPDGEIPLDRTSTPVNIVPAFDRVARETRATDTAQVAKAFDAVSAVLRRTAPEMQGTLRGLSRLSHTVASRDHRFRDLFSRARQVTGTVAARDQEIGQLLRASDTVLAVLARRRAAIRQLVAGTTSLSQQLRGLVDDNRTTFGPALARLGTVLDVLHRDELYLDRILTYAAVYGREFTNVGGSGHWFDSSIKVPRGAAVCSTGDSTEGLTGLLAPALSQVNTALTGSRTPCLPLGPPTDGGAGGPAPSGGGAR